MAIYKGFLHQSARPRLVPRRFSEKTFWSRYFAALRREIQQLSFAEAVG
jgi:hypothetical protein